MNSKIKKIIFLFLIILIVGIASYFFYQPQDKTVEVMKSIENKIVAENPYYETSLQIKPKCTYGELMTQAEICNATSTMIFEATQDIYDLSHIRVGREIKLHKDKQTDELKKLIYQIDTEEELHVNLQDDGTWKAERKPIEYEVKIKTSEGIIKSSLYKTGLEQGLDEVAIIQLAEVFQWTIDFAMNIRVGDSFKFIYEERYLNGEYVMPGNILAAKFINDNREYIAYYYEQDEDSYGYYNTDGESMQKIFLKAPVSYKYISSGFTTGMRYVQAFNTSTKHQAIDYAAPYGTPIKAVGDGTVVRAGWNGGYGNFISIRHNSTYTTNYAHLSRYAVGYGAKVTQGQTIGYVGSTGFSTGPHVHYEMVKFGTKINPQTEDFPNTDALEDENLEKFKSEIVTKYQKKL